MKLAGLGKFITQNLGSVTKNVLPGTALSAGFGLLAEGPKAGLVYGATDLLGSLPATMLGRYAGRNIKSEGLRNAIEGGANLAGSLAGSVVGSNILYGGQPQQIAQQIEQRSVVNQLPLAEQLVERSPGTNFQTVGLSPRAEFEQLLNQGPRSTWATYLSPEDQLILQEMTRTRI